jgi:MYXO-CTERM domain-containing protein
MRPAALVLLLGAATFAPSARADDAGVDASAADASGSPDASEGIRETSVDNWGCATAPGPSPSWAWALAGLVVAGAVLARRRRAAALTAALLVLALPTFARADERDALREVRVDPPPFRRLTLSLAPLSPMIGRWGGAVELVLASHHAIGLSGAWVRTHTNEDTNNVFTGGIGELGYRWYSGENGPRGFFVGPSFVFGAFSAIPERGSTIAFFDVGGALDVGFSALAFDRVLFALGAGVQYTAPTATFPDQELPASIYARPGVRPRLLLAIGVAF